MFFSCLGKMVDRVFNGRDDFGTNYHNCADKCRRILRQNELEVNFPVKNFLRTPKFSGSLRAYLCF